ncbi:uncharacterized protein AMSG_07821 [Thecamonas trahens ATCC 50062]|uniref:Steroid 5-alpha reductase C-terminal domain-containing protein n=1 Tax=Thecamonas trahens ATCC 50062 TaxID=461836 RepID=A0A0L0DHG5_THETB|nr:hypothetical protein AMSG_07821 [Thecamonas trahens ATCC 50062]KNC51752.1 hypothetical protein AMSG_07821 [Thecamonas trahens ATCC 50062]|eukprot:XP_013755880.1 hypothetical protein AMSG_07821 [Thecamonas trahens ATCC 50062]
MAESDESVRQRINLAVLVLVALPAVVCVAAVRASCSCVVPSGGGGVFASPASWLVASAGGSGSWWQDGRAMVKAMEVVIEQAAGYAQCTPVASHWMGLPLPAATCAVAGWHPLLLANVLFALNVTAVFWLVGLVQGSFWLIDPYWSLIPPAFFALAALHPAGDPALAPGAPGWSRFVVCVALVVVWALRLTHSYFRREEWQIGAREDWRYVAMRERFGKAWPLLSLWYVFGVQHLLLVGISLPIFAVVGSADQAWTVMDTMATAAAVCGLLLAHVADNELYEFVTTREMGEAPLLCTGTWRYSRHPNHFGEGLFWTALGGFALACGAGWMLVTVLVEERMMASPARSHLYKLYQKSTSRLIPWWKLAWHSQG